jgi:hypothetical protein
MKKTVEGLVAAKDYILTDDPEIASKRLNTLTYDLVNGGANLTGLPMQVPKLIQKMTKSEPVKESDWTVSN